MASITIVSGAPGTGKTTLARALAAADPQGLHLASDCFYTFPAHPIDPTRPESHAQNTTIVRALGRAAAAFAEGGYGIFLDGIVGPWFLPTLVAELPSEAPLEYVVLRAPLAETLERVRRRDGAGASARVAHMHRAFADLGDYAQHAVDAAAADPAGVLARVREGRARGRFALAPGAVRCPPNARSSSWTHWPGEPGLNRLPRRSDP